MLPQEIGNERLSKKFRALTEISKTVTSPLGFSERLNSVIKNIVSLVEQANIGSIVGWCRPATFGFDLEMMKEMAQERRHDRPYPCSFRWVCPG